MQHADNEAFEMTDTNCRPSPEPALGIGKLGSRLGPPTGGASHRNHKKKKFIYIMLIMHKTKYRRINIGV